MILFGWSAADPVGNARRRLGDPFHMPDRTHCVYTTQTRSPPTRLQRLTQGLRLMRCRFKAQALPMLVAIVLVAVVERPLVSVGRNSNGSRRGRFPLARKLGVRFWCGLTVWQHLQASSRKRGPSGLKASRRHRQTLQGCQQISWTT